MLIYDCQIGKIKFDTYYNEILFHLDLASVLLDLISIQLSWFHFRVSIQKNRDNRCLFMIVKSEKINIKLTFKISVLQDQEHHPTLSNARDDLET